MLSPIIKQIVEEISERKFTMGDADIKGLLKNDLIEQCKLLGMDTKGNKPVLVERLIKAREDGHCYLPPELVGNADIVQLVSDGFSPLSRWEILEEPADKLLLTDELEVNNMKYRAPTTPREEYERTGDGGGGSKKINFCNYETVRPEFRKEAEVPKLNRYGHVI